MSDFKESQFAFALDAEEKILSPTRSNNAWKLLRLGKAKMLERYPLVIQLFKVVNKEDLDESKFTIGVDDGSKHVGIALVQSCSTKTKGIFKGVIELRSDVSDKITKRAGFRRSRRGHKRYRPARFLNKASSKKSGRIPPSIKQKKDSIIRLLKRFQKWIKIDSINLEDVLIDTRLLLNPDVEDYQKSNRLHENLRLATLMRDNFKCILCNSKEVRLEVHHILPRRFKGLNTITNLITLCNKCHQGISGVELNYLDKFYKYTKGKPLRLDYASHVMQGKNYLRFELSKLAKLDLTFGYKTSEVRKFLGFEKSHSNDALIIAGFRKKAINLVEFLIKPLRYRVACNTKSLLGFRHRDYVKYIKKNGFRYLGFISSLFPERKSCSISLLDGKVLSKYGLKSTKLLYRFKGLVLVPKVI